jgi:anthranilate phosphoribosyltransferase
MIKEAIEKLIRYEDLDAVEAFNTMKYIMEGKAGDCQISAFLIALKMKGESIEEISAFSRVMLEKANRIKTIQKNVVDTCGTGGDCKNTFNISTTAAFIAAGAGIAIAKHGNRSVSSKSGSADVLEAMGVNINIETSSVERCINDLGIGFIFAPKAHTAMANVAKARKEMGVKTVFNILGPLTNPAGASGRVIGVYDRKLIDLMINSLKNLGVENAFVVHGDDGMDELSVCSTNQVAYLRKKKIKKYTLDPVKLGIKKHGLKELAGGTAEDNARITLEILSGKVKGAKRDSAVLNAAAAIITGAKADNWNEAIGLASESIDRGKAMEKLYALIDLTNRL